MNWQVAGETTGRNHSKCDCDALSCDRTFLYTVIVTDVKDDMIEKIDACFGS